MMHIRKTTAIVAVLVAATITYLASCSNDEVITQHQSSAIHFVPVVDNAQNLMCGLVMAAIM